MSIGKLMIIDGNSILNRAFYGLKGSSMLATTDGVNTNAIFGFINILNKFMKEEIPDYLCVAFDLKAPTFRHLEFSGYKAKRKGMPPELAEQLPYMKEILDAMNIKRLELEGYEADDIIGSISLCAEQQGMDVVIITGDRDSLQLASKTTRILMPVTRAGRTETEAYDSDGVKERYGVTPEQFIDVKGLMGDQSDNIPGVPGIGEKTATELIKAYGSIDGIYENIDKISRESVKKRLEENKDLAYMSRHIAEIDRNMPTLCQLHELKRGNFDKERLYKIFKRLEFASLIDKFGLDREEYCLNSSLKDIEFTMVDDIITLARIAGDIEKAGEAAIFHLIDRKNAFDFKLAGFALSWGSQNAYVEIGKGISEKQFFQLFHNIFENDSIKFYGHDLKSLIVHLKWNGISFSGMAFDTLIGAYILNASKETYTIPELCRDYLDYSIEPLSDLTGRGKNTVPYTEIPSDKLSKISVIHSRTIFELANTFKKNISKNGQDNLYYEIELPLIEVLADMEFRGFKVNREGLVQFSAHLDDKIKSAEDDIYELAGESFNINSPKQLGQILFEKLQLPVIKKTKTGYSTDAKVLEQLSGKHEAVYRIIEYRQLAKLKSTYAEGLLNVINPLTGRIHSSFNQTVTATGRISSTEPNLQNIPIKLEMGREIRKVFEAESSDYLLSDADYSQIELRVLAHITGDENMISAFRNNEDIHTATASAVFNIPADQVTQMLRSRAKAVNFGIVYGIGDFSLANDLGISRKEARRYIDEYLEKYPGVKQYMKDSIDNAREKGYAQTIFNRRRYLPEISSSNFNIRSFGERVAMNMPIQGSAADIIKIAMVKVYNELRKHNMKSRLILQVHDELIIETYAEERTAVESILQNCMQNAVNLDVPIIAEVKTGRSWYDTK